MTSNLIRHGFETSSRLIQIGNQVEEEIQNRGVVGFGRAPLTGMLVLSLIYWIVPNACPDADDTAKALVALTLQGKSCSPQALVDRFERENHFATYLYETHTSVSTNANVLTALVMLSTDSHYQPQIEKCIRYLCDAWFHCDGMVKDKWVCYTVIANHIRLHSDMIDRTVRLTIPPCSCAKP